MTTDVKDIRNEKSPIGSSWCPVYQMGASFSKDHFEKAMINIIRHPNVNSTVIMRADIMKDEDVNMESNNNYSTIVNSVNPPLIDPIAMPLTHNIDDINPRNGKVDNSFLKLSKVMIRRIIPRNPLRDAVINQSCLIYIGVNDPYTMLIVYLPHLLTPDACPFYLPPVEAVGILYHQQSVSLHYIPFTNVISSPPQPLQTDNPNISNINSVSSLSELSDSDRAIRIALHLLQTCHKHSNGVMNGYKKRVNHDLVVEKVAFQDRYIDLKQKYAKDLVSNWVENTDPKKHVFEDLAIAAFLIELWTQMYSKKDEFLFYDLGCGNGLLVHILINEGYQGTGIDARARKSWGTYPANVRSQLVEQVIVPKGVFIGKPSAGDDSSNTNVTKNNSGNNTTFATPITPIPTYDNLANNPSVNLLDLPENSFIIGNHSDELTVWIPLLGYPFMVIPCCSHSISGARFRFPPRDSKDPDSKSSYSCLVNHVEDISREIGWKVEKEMLRIPSTRNAAIIGRTRSTTPPKTVDQIIKREGGADGWIERTMSLQSKSPRNH